ncbi:TSUP family transporter [Spiractinospora alimapuensis]|uniref:TSUP family transporter n=1 Tax=Spiractinospora alimapuensis TaxID=2820884 RepID=UPI001F1E3085|nr:TSUP family transporter [Spiractinospora alimapuensis]QVQ54910.1 TSUP family transporter [Spiractinospora alimapuensis]
MGWEIVALLLAAALFAGWLDAVVGGGGLVLLPALMAALPGAPVPALLGTNKLASVFGTTSAAIAYARRVKIDWRLIAPTVGLALLGSGLGAAVAGSLSSDALRPLIIGVLLIALVVVVLRPGLGATPSPRLLTRERVIALLVLCGLGVSFYDGLVGPGTGVFLVIAFATITGVDFIGASASAKVVNAATNLGAVTVFAVNGQVYWLLGLTLALGTSLGAQIGARTAVRAGTGFIRAVLVVVVVALLCRLGYEQFTGV